MPSVDELLIEISAAKLSDDDRVKLFDAVDSTRASVRAAQERKAAIEAIRAILQQVSAYIENEWIVSAEKEGKALPPLEKIGQDISDKFDAEGAKTRAAELAQIKADMEGANTQLAAVRVIVETDKVEIEGLLAKIGSHLAQIDSQKTEITGLKEQVAAQAADLASLQKALANKSVESDTNKAQAEELRGMVAAAHEALNP